ncbi:MAG: YciI family protein [Rhodospirillales bacterium]|nr:YciI family protein [Rhodospirillales bacterium]MBO6787762.1 YciI family protein [Rhodospirillales bacterium]
MHFVIYCLDKPDHAHVRADNRPAHVEYLKASAGKIVCAGPMLTDDGEGMIGSTLVMEFADRAEADAWAANDPYAKAGLFESVSIRPWKKVFPAD